MLVMVYIFILFYFPAKTASGSGTMVDPSPHHPNVKGSSPAKSERELLKKMLFLSVVAIERIQS
jgi:hypothetical protein